MTRKEVSHFKWKGGNSSSLPYAKTVHSRVCVSLLGSKLFLKKVMMNILAEEKW